MQTDDLPGPTIDLGESHLQLVYGSAAVDWLLAIVQREIDNRSAYSPTTLVGVLDAAAMFTVDLARRLQQAYGLNVFRDVELAWWRPGEPWPDVSFDRQQIVCDTICDSGETLLRAHKAWISAGYDNPEPQDRDGPSREPYSLYPLEAAVLIEKHPRRIQLPMLVLSAIDAVAEDFFVGYGLDDNHAFRHLPGIYRKVGHVGPMRTRDGGVVPNGER